MGPAFLALTVWGGLLNVTWAFLQMARATSPEATVTFPWRVLASLLSPFAIALLGKVGILSLEFHVNCGKEGVAVVWTGTPRALSPWVLMKGHSIGPAEPRGWLNPGLAHPALSPQGAAIDQNQL